MKAVVFVGPTITEADVHRVLDAECRPPASLGDVYRAVLDGFAILGIVDGYFELQPAVWHKEVLWAMGRGVHVFGSASMGALRATELEAFGMVGVGEVFEAFRDGVLEDDDEVAVAHASAEHGFRAGSDAMVNIRATLRKAVGEGVIEKALAEEIEQSAKRSFYANRSFAHLMDEFPTLAVHRHWFRANEVNVKRGDALQMLEAMRLLVTSDKGPKRVDYVMEETVWWEAFKWAEAHGRVSADDRRVLDSLAQQPELAHEARIAAVAWRLATQLALANGTLPDGLRIAGLAQSFCKRHCLVDERAFGLWLKENQWTREDMDRLLEAIAEADACAQDAGAELDWYVLGYLRWNGRYSKLLAAASKSG